MATITLKLVSNQYDENGAIKVTEKDIAFPENVTLDKVTMEHALQTVISSHRSFLYGQASAKESSKNEPNMETVTRLEEAESACTRNNPNWEAESDEEYHGIQFLAFCIDNAMHRTYLNGKPVMMLPTGGTDILASFRDYKEGRITFSELKKKVVAFAEGLNSIPFLKDRTIRFTDEDINYLVSMYKGIGQPMRWNKKGINARKVTKASLIQQIGLFALQKAFKFSEEEKVKKVVEF